jgi:cell division protein FtsB
MKRKRKKAGSTEFHTLKRIDNSRLVRNIEPVRLRNFYRMAGLGSIIAVFFMMYIYQHFRCIDLSFQLEDLKAKQTQSVALNSELRLEIEGLRDPRRIDLIARHQLGLTEPLPTQVLEYDAVSVGEVAAARYVRPNRAQ